VQSQEMCDALPKGTVFVIPHEVDFNTFKPTNREQARATLGLRRDRKYLLFAANPKIPVKRFPLAQAVARHLAGRDPAIELLVVYKEPQERLALYMSACDALLFPSYQEGSPNVVKQAMACNLPIVATDVGDVRQIIGNCQGCYVCGPSTDEFSARAGQILVDRDRTTGRDHIRHLDSLSVAKQVIGVYEHVIRRRPHRLSDRVESDALLQRKQFQ